MKLKPITKKNLISLGLSRYQTDKVCATILPMSVVGRRKLYNVSDVINSINSYLANYRIKKSTRERLERAKSILLPIIDNIVIGDFGKESLSELGKLAKKAMAEQAELNQMLANLEIMRLELIGET